MSVRATGGVLKATCALHVLSLLRLPFVFSSLAQTGFGKWWSLQRTHAQYVLSTIIMEGNWRLQTNGTGEHKVKAYAVR